MARAWRDFFKHFAPLIFPQMAFSSSIASVTPKSASQQRMAELDNRFHGLPPLKRFKMQQKERFEPLPSARPSSRMVQVRCLPAKKRVCALDFLHLVSDNASDDKENEPDLKSGLEGFLPAPHWAIEPSDLSRNHSKAGHGNCQILAPLKPNIQIHPTGSVEKDAGVAAHGKTIREATEEITPLKKRARFSIENGVPSGECAAKASLDRTKGCKGHENSTEAKARPRKSSENLDKKIELETKTEQARRNECNISSSKKKGDCYESGLAKDSHQKSRNKESSDAKHFSTKKDGDHSLNKRDHCKYAVTSCGTKLQRSCASVGSTGKASEVAKRNSSEEVERSSSVPARRGDGVKERSVLPAIRVCHSRCDEETVVDHPSGCKANDENVHSTDTGNHQEEKEEEEDGVLCDVCREADADETDPIVFCDGCDVMVHTSCYGWPLIEAVPEGDWFCNKCMEGREGKEERQCCLCPKKGGAMKETTGGGWAHLSCALFVPEVFYKKAKEREGIECGKVPAWRWQLPCVLCSSTTTRTEAEAGACIQCTEAGCSATFHVSCAMDAGLSLDIRVANSFTPAIVIAFCPSHSDQALSTSERRRFKIVPRH